MENNTEPTNQLKKGSFPRLVEIIFNSLLKLNAQISMEDLEYIAVTVHKAMTMQTRHFHTLEHVFALSNTTNPIQSLAGLYHDVVYYQVDSGFSPEIENMVSNYIFLVNNEIFLRDKPLPEDRIYNLTLETFNFTPGQKLKTSEGLNEFLSALVMNKQLEGIVPEKYLLVMTVCVEATIPFQKRNAEGKSHFDILEERLRSIIQRHNYDLTAEEIHDAIKLSVTFSNKDVENFAVKDPRRFLNNTWKLLPETNIALRARHIYSVREYRQALQNMANFLNNLDPITVFNQHDGYPNNQRYRHLVKYAEKNILAARSYLQVRLLSMSVLEAIAEATGGDAPISLFIGEINEPRGKTHRLEDFLPEPDSYHNDEDPVLLKLLLNGRAVKADYGLKNSPLSLFLFRRLDPDCIQELSQFAMMMFSGQITPQDFLKKIDCQTFKAVANACAMMMFTRKDKIFQLMEECLE